jgi:hypothetical protein
MTSDKVLAARTVTGMVVATAAATIVGFWLSYSGLQDFAVRSGLTGAEAWAWPASVDLFIAAGEAGVTISALRRQKDKAAWAYLARRRAGRARSRGPGPHGPRRRRRPGRPGRGRGGQLLSVAGPPGGRDKASTIPDRRPGPCRAVPLSPPRDTRTADPPPRTRSRYRRGPGRHHRPPAAARCPAGNRGEQAITLAKRTGRM